MNTEKSEGTALILAIILGLFGLVGIGHLYLGRIGKGIGMLVIGIICLVFIPYTMFISGIVLLAIFIYALVDIRSIARRE